MKRFLLILAAVPVGGILGGFLGALAVSVIQHFMGAGNSHQDAVDLYGMTVLGGMAGSVLAPVATFFMTRPSDE